MLCIAIVYFDSDRISLRMALQLNANLSQIIAELQTGVAGAFLSVRLIRIYRYVVYCYCVFRFGLNLLTKGITIKCEFIEGPC